MAENDTQNTAPVEDAPAAEESKAPDLTPPETPVVVQEGALVGDDAVNDKLVKVEPVVNSDATEQAYAPEAGQQTSYPVFETSIALDRVITDPTSPEAVQIPDAGRGTLDLPARAAAGERVEDFFAREASEVDESTSVLPEEERNS